MAYLFVTVMGEEQFQLSVSERVLFLVRSAKMKPLIQLTFFTEIEITLETVSRSSTSGTSFLTTLGFDSLNFI